MTNPTAPSTLSLGLVFKWVRDTLKWFKHFSDASDDEFLAEIEDIFGLEGYARWWKLLEAVAKQMDETDKCSASYSWIKWQTILKGKRNKLETFLVHSQNKQKTFLKQTGNILEIKIPKLLELRDNYTNYLKVTKKQEVEEEVEVDLKQKKGKKSEVSSLIFKENFIKDVRRREKDGQYVSSEDKKNVSKYREEINSKLKSGEI